jgi:uncharacterized membrane protein
MSDEGARRAARSLPGDRVVTGLLDDLQHAREAVRDLKAAGFRDEDIGLAMVQTRDEADTVSANTTATEGATAGAVGGGVLGGFTGLLVGVGVVAVPGLGPLLAGGALSSALGLAGASAAAGAGIGAATGGIIGALVDLNIPETDARDAEAGLRAGRILLTVTAGNRCDEALAIVKHHGAEATTDGEGSSGTVLL